MSLIKSKNTKPEITIRRIVYGLGFRYRLHGKLPGKPDLVFKRHKKLIFVHGCFWHRHPSSKCKLARLPKSRLNFWKPKLEKNKERDRANQKLLRKMGWDVLVVWECELKDKLLIAQKIRKFLETKNALS